MDEIVRYSSDLKALSRNSGQIALQISFGWDTIDATAASRYHDLSSDHKTRGHCCLKLRVSAARLVRVDSMSGSLPPVEDHHGCFWLTKSGSRACTPAAELLRKRLSSLSLREAWIDEMGCSQTLVREGVQECWAAMKSNRYSLQQGWKDRRCWVSEWSRPTPLTSVTLWGSSKSLDRGCLDRLGAKEVVVRVEPSNSDGTWFWTRSLSKSAVIIEQKAKGPFPIFL